MKILGFVLQIEEGGEKKRNLNLEFLMKNLLKKHEIFGKKIEFFL